MLITSSETSQQINVPPPPPLPTDVRYQVTVPPPPPLPTDVRSQVTVSPPPPLPTDLRSQVTVSPPPPLPSNLKIEDRLETTETAKRTSSASPAKEETSGPVVTHSLLQMVRLRSVKSSQSPAVDLDKPSQPKPKSGVNQEAPPKPIRRSLILTSLPPDVEALSNTEPKTEVPSLDTTTTTVSIIGKDHLNQKFNQITLMKKLKIQYLSQNTHQLHAHLLNRLTIQFLLNQQLNNPVLKQNPNPKPSRTKFNLQYLTQNPSQVQQNKRTNQSVSQRLNINHKNPTRPRIIQRSN